MSTGKTKYLGLHRWEPNDSFLRTEFNENSDKLDSELEQFHAEMADEFSAVRTEMQEGLSDHRHNAGDITGGTLPVARGGTGVTDLAGLANALKNAAPLWRTATGSYVGTGTYGANNPNTINFPFKPAVCLVFIGGSCENWVVFTQDVIFMPFNIGRYLSANKLVNTDWGKSLKWYTTIAYSDEENAESQLNAAGKTYTYWALG